MTTIERLALRALGSRALALFGGSALWDRYIWARAYLPRTLDRLRLLDVGCGNGTFTMLAAERGYDAVGLTWDEAHRQKAMARAAAMRANPRFVPFDVRALDTYDGGPFETILCLENIEHIIDDDKLMKDMAALLTERGYLIMTTPYYFFRRWGPSSDGPYAKTVEDGWHVRRGASRSLMTHLGERHGLTVEHVEYIGGWVSNLLMKFSDAVPIPGSILQPLLIPIKLIGNMWDRIGRPRTGARSMCICVVYQKLS